MDVDRIVSRYRARATELAEGAPVSLPWGMPDNEARRSPAADAVARLAARDGLFCFHFEHRAHLPLPEAWVDPSDPTLADPPEWDGGILPERKYQSFRHDLPIGSFHPHHRAKWSTHELCHGLVGFAWRPDATPFFTATAGRLAELLPVVLWYTFDEAFLRRCPDHDGGGALFRTFCPACERAAMATPDAKHAESHIREGLRYLDRELAAIARSRRLGRPICHRFATLDLASDGVAYALAHHERLSSPAFARFAERFTVSGGGLCTDLDTLEARVWSVASGILGEDIPATLAPSAEQGRARWTLQDLGWRLLQIASETEGTARHALHTIVDGLARHIPATVEPKAVVPLADALQVAASTYGDLAAAFSLPPPEAVFALGYPAHPIGDATEQITAGLGSACPLLSEGSESGLRDAVRAFLSADVPRRGHLARRWSDWMGSRTEGVLADLARWEAAVAELPRSATPHLPGPAASTRWQLRPGFTALRFGHDVLRLAERIDAGEVAVDPSTLAVQVHGGHAPPPEPQGLVLGRDGSGQVMLLDVDPDTAARLAAGPFEEHELDEHDHASLAELGAIVPESLAATAPRP